MQKLIVLTIAVMCLAACSKKPSALETCQKLEAAGIAAGCKADQPAGLGAGAKEKVAFDLPSVAGKTGAVFTFGDDAAFDATVGAFEKAAILAGPHRYGSKKALTFVQINNGLAAADGAKAKGVVDAL